MTLQAVAGWLGQAGLQHPAALYRNMLAAVVGRRTGYFRPGDFLIAPSGSGMTITMGRGDAFLMGTEGAPTQGGYFVWNDTQEIIAFPASNTLPRFDSLILRVVDTDYGSDPGGSKAMWEVVSGTPAASPVVVPDSAFAPAGAYYRPGAWFRVANFSIGANITNMAAATQTNFAQYNRLGRRSVAASTARPADPQVGDLVQESDNGYGSSVWDGSKWAADSRVGLWRSLVPYLPANMADISTLSGGSGGISFAPLSYQQVGNRVRFRGGIKRTTGNFTTGENVLTGIPAGIRSQYTQSITISSQSIANAGSSIRFGTDPASSSWNVTITAIGGTANTPTWINLDGVEYETY